MTALAARWEARLRAEGLGYLDCPVGDDILVSSRGGGKDARWREEAAAEREARPVRVRAARARAGRPGRRWGWTRATALRVLRLHAQGLGYRAVADRAGLPPRKVRRILAQTTGDAGDRGDATGTRISVGDLLTLSDTGILLRLVAALGAL